MPLCSCLSPEFSFALALGCGAASTVVNCNVFGWVGLVLLG